MGGSGQDARKEGETDMQRQFSLAVRAGGQEPGASATPLGPVVSAPATALPSPRRSSAQRAAPRSSRSVPVTPRGGNSLGVVDFLSSPLAVDLGADDELFASELGSVGAGADDDAGLEMLDDDSRWFYQPEYPEEELEAAARAAAEDEEGHTEDEDEGRTEDEEDGRTEDEDELEDEELENLDDLVGGGQLHSLQEMFLGGAMARRFEEEPQPSTTVVGRRAEGTEGAEESGLRSGVFSPRAGYAMEEGDEGFARLPQRGMRQFDIEKVFADLDAALERGALEERPEGVQGSVLGSVQLSRQLRQLVESQRHGMVKRIRAMKHKQENLASSLIAQKKKVELMMSKPPVIRRTHTTAFTLGVLGSWLLLYVMVAHREQFPVFYAVVILSLILYRYYTYHRSKFHYFMLDYCYFAHAILLFYLFLYPTSPHLFGVLFAICNGPIAWAITVWRNSLVFHDLDKTTSLLLHVFPPLVTYVVRWNPGGRYRIQTPGWGTSRCCFLSWTDGFFWPLIFFLFWQVCYVLKISVVDRRKIVADPGIVTSVRWLSQRGELLSKLHKEHNSFAFAYLQLTYHILCLLVVKLMFRWEWVHFLFLVYMISMSVRNGASFYFEVFFFKYMKAILPSEDVQQRLNEVMMRLKAEKKGETERKRARKRARKLARRGGLPSPPAPPAAFQIPSGAVP